MPVRILSGKLVALLRARPLGSDQTRAGHLFGSDRHREFDAQIGERRARGAGLFALATETGTERLADDIRKTLVAARFGATLRLDALTPHQAHFRAGR